MSTLLERLRVAVTTYKGDFATLQLLTECGAELERLTVTSDQYRHLKGCLAIQTDSAVKWRREYKVVQNTARKFEERVKELAALNVDLEQQLAVAELHLSATSSIAQEKIQEVDGYRAKLEVLESERRKLRDIVRQSYLYMVGRLPESEHKQLGRDLAMYGAQNGPVNTPPKP